MADVVNMSSICGLRALLRVISGDGYRSNIGPGARQDATP
jgi:hypothetical protein